MISAALILLETDEQRNKLADFYKKNRHRLYKIAFSKLHSREEAEDAVQDAFLKIADRPDTFFSLSDEERIPYVYTVVKHASFDIYNKNNHINTSELTENITLGNYPEFLEKLVLDEIAYKEIIEFIKNLPKLQQNVLVLTRLSKLSISETAQQLNISKTAVNQRLYLARKAIKQFIEERRKRND